MRDTRGDAGPADWNAMPPARTRAWVSIAIGCYLIWQVLVPLGFYFARDRGDERFAWRIFSVDEILADRCVMHVTEDLPAGFFITSREVDLPRLIHASWFRELRRGRSLPQRLLTWRCGGDPRASRVAFARTCTRPDGTTSRVDFARDCVRGETTGSEEGTPR
jgi:hypothetical protein